MEEGNAMANREFNTDGPIAYFITWTTYGTWLPGDEGGSWHRGRYQSPNELFREMAAAEMRETAFTLSQEDRAIVQETVTKPCEIRAWKLHTVRARSNHVHIVVTAPGYKPETVGDQFKAWCTRLLKPRHPGRERFWTKGGSRRCMNHEDDLEAVITYVNEAQDRKGSEIQARRASE